MPNPLNISDVKGLTDRSIKKIHIKEMPHKKIINITKKFGNTILSGFRNTVSIGGFSGTARLNNPKFKSLPIIKGGYNS